MRIRDVRRLGCIASVTAAVALVAACSSSTPTPSAPSTCAAAVVPSDQLNRTAEAGGGSLTIPVTASTGCTWTAASNASFITIASGASGSGNGTVTATVAANSGSQRIGTLSIGSSTVTVTQAGSSAPCTFSVSPATVPMRDGAGTASVSVTAAAGCAWTAVSNSVFITVTSGGAGSGNGTVGISVTANTGAFRTGTLTIAGQTVTVNQDAAGICVTSISPAIQSFEGSGGNGVVTVSAPETCGWQVTSNADFITVPPGTRGSGNSSFAFSVASNTTTAPREGTVSVGGRVLTVTQNGTCATTVSPTTLALDGSERSNRLGLMTPVTVTMSGSCSWAASGASASWLLSASCPSSVCGGPVSGTGSGTLYLGAYQNNIGSTRSGTILVAGQTVTVTQTPCAFSLLPATQTVGAAATSVSFTTTSDPARCVYRLRSSADYLSIPFQPFPGYEGANTIAVGVSANSGSASRTATVLMTGASDNAGLGADFVVGTATLTQSGTQTVTAAAPPRR